MSPKHLAFSMLFLSACIVANPFNRGDFGDTGDSGDTTPGDGDPVTGDGDPVTGDGDPTTGDGDPTTGDGDPTTGDGDPTTGDGDPGDTCKRKLWEFDFGTEQWSSEPLDAAWTGANAPSCENEIWATTYVEASDQLLVFTADGLYYRRKSGAWDPPVAISARFPELGNLTIESMVYVPAINGDPASLLINSLPNAYLYSIQPNGSVAHTDTVPIMDEPNGGPPQSSVVRHWAMTRAKGQLLGSAGWWNSWQGFDNGRLYFVDGAFNWDSWPEVNNPLFSNGPNEPSASEIEAAWGDFDQQRGYAIGP